MRLSPLLASLLVAPSLGCGLILGLEESPLRPDQPSAGASASSGHAGASGAAQGGKGGSGQPSAGAGGQSAQGGGAGGTTGQAGAGSGGKSAQGGGGQSAQGGGGQSAQGGAGQGGAGQGGQPQGGAGQGGAGQAGGGQAGAEQGGAGQGGAGQGGAGQGGAGGEGGAGQGGAGKGGAQGGAGQGGAGGGVLAPLTLTDAELVGAPDAEVSQGTVGFTVKLTGTGFTKGLVAHLGGLAAKFVVIGSDQSATALFDIPHGATLGAVPLLLDLDGQSATGPLVTITAIHTGGAGANDVTGLGTPKRPFATLAPAIGKSGAGDTVVVTGTVPFGNVTSTEALDVPAGVQVVGDTAQGGTVDGDGISPRGLLLHDGVQIERLTITGFTASCIETAALAKVGLVDVTLRQCGTRALRASDGAVVVMSGTNDTLCSLEQSETGLECATGTTVTLQRCGVRGNSSYGVHADGAGSVLLSKSVIENNGGGFAYGVGVRVLAGSKVTLADSTLRANPHVALLVEDGDSKEAEAKLTGACIVENNGNPQNDYAAGLWAGGGKSLTIEGAAIIRGNFGGGVYRDLDGTSGDGECDVSISGATFVDNGVALAIWAPGAFTMSNTTVTGSADPAYAAVGFWSAATPFTATLTDITIASNDSPSSLAFENAATGVVQAGPKATCTITGAVHAGVLVSAAQVTMTGCQVNGNQGDGAQVVALGKLTANNCSFSNNGSDPVSNGAGLYADSGAQLSLIGPPPGSGAYACNVKGNSRLGLLLDGVAQATINNCDISENAPADVIGPTAGARLLGVATVNINGSRLSANRGDGLLLEGSPRLTVQGATQISGNTAAGVHLTTAGSDAIAFTGTAITTNGTDQALALVARSGIYDASPSGNRPLSLSSVTVSSNGGAGFALLGTAPVAVSIGSSTFSSNQYQGLLVANALARVDLGCDTCTTTGQNVFSLNNTAAGAFQEASADLQDARGASGPPMTIRGLTFDAPAASFDTAQTISSPTKLFALPTRWGFIKEQPGSDVVVFAP